MDTKKGKMVRALGQCEGRRWVLWGALGGTGSTIEQHLDAAWPSWLRAQDADGSLYRAYLVAGRYTAAREPVPAIEE